MKLKSDVDYVDPRTVTWWKFFVWTSFSDGTLAPLLGNNVENVESEERMRAIHLPGTSSESSPVWLLDSGSLSELSRCIMRVTFESSVSAY